MTADRVENRDYIAALANKKPLDFDSEKKRMYRSILRGNMMRMVKFLVNEFIPECEFVDNGREYFIRDFLDRSHWV